MANCPKCNATIEAPLKTWKIKQTPIALYECNVCKAKWRTKIGVVTVKVNPIQTPEAAVAGRTEVKATLRPVSIPQATVPSADVSQPSGIRRFFSVLFGL
jgi:uncharacterized protein YlaI